MSKIRSKDLQYDKEASQPAFLQRLRNQNASFTSSGRQENPVARPQRLRTAADEDEDAPTYVVEGSSEVLSREQYQKLASGEADDDDDDNDDAEKEGEEAKGPSSESKDKQAKKSVIDAGAPAAKKRKAVKVIGGDSDTEKGDLQKSEAAAPKKKPKKKAKAIKLSFGDDE